ncbi:tetratricopeptide repeat protein [Brevibacillus ginsengisoli]|uniref:tetratricopeptide repeat protein n=1 Tax=Brevibacillus ginsengisoli TaxID=363854 RepID=UPI003CEDB8DA
MSKFLLFSILWWITGSPIAAILVLLFLLYLLDLRFVRLLPNLFKPFQLNRRLTKLKQELRLNPHDTAAKLEVARIYMEKRRYQEALKYLEEIKGVMQDSTEFLSDYGISLIKTGKIEAGEALIKEALAKNPRVKYGEPYLHLSEAFIHANKTKALAYLEECRSLHSSSVEVVYKMGVIYQQLQQKEQAKRTYAEAVDVYRGLPAYKKRTERRWAILARWKMWFG